MAGTKEAYAALIQEVSDRLEAMNHVLLDKSGLGQELVKELCYLQLRMCCEVIALACLVAHGDIPATQTSALNREWAADQIIKRLTELRPDFYPRAVRKQQQGPGHWHMADFEGDYLTKDDLISLIRKCGVHLHRGSLKSLSKTRPSHQDTVADIVKWGNKISFLLHEHVIVFEWGEVFYCMLKSADHAGKVMLWSAGAADRG